MSPDIFSLSKHNFKDDHTVTRKLVHIHGSPLSVEKQNYSPLFLPLQSNEGKESSSHECLDRIQPD